jgi:hypothetical protein
MLLVQHTSQGLVCFLEDFRNEKPGLCGRSLRGLRGRISNLKFQISNRANAKGPLRMTATCRGYPAVDAGRLRGSRCRLSGHGPPRRISDMPCPYCAFDGGDSGRRRPPRCVSRGDYFAVGFFGLAEWAGAAGFGRQKSGAAATTSSGGLLSSGTRRKRTVSASSTASALTLRNFL